MSDYLQGRFAVQAKLIKDGGPLARDFALASSPPPYGVRTLEQREALARLPVPLRIWASNNSWDAYRPELQRILEEKIVYEPAFGWQAVDRAWLFVGQAVLQSPWQMLERGYSLVSGTEVRGQFTNFEGIMGVMDGVPGADPGRMPLANDLATVMMDTGVTLLSFTGIGAFANIGKGTVKAAAIMPTWLRVAGSVGRTSAIIGRPVLSAAGMSLVSMSGLPQEYQRPLMIGMGLLGNPGALNLARPSLYRSLMSQTAVQWANARQIVTSLGSQIRNLPTAARNIANALIEQARIQAQQLGQRLQALRAIGGQTLANLENAVIAAANDVRRATVRLIRRGLDPFGRKQARVDARQARGTQATAEKGLRQGERTVEHQAVAQGVVESVTNDLPGTGLVPRSTVSLGRWGEVRLAQVLGGLGSKPRNGFWTDYGYRFVDRLLNGVAHEAKAGLNMGLTSKLRLQALKDVELIAAGRIQASVWHFFQGAKQELIDFLTDNGIQHVVH